VRESKLRALDRELDERLASIKVGYISFTCYCHWTPIVGLSDIYDAVFLGIIPAHRKFPNIYKCVELKITGREFD